jgi:hypothetical protein
MAVVAAATMVAMPAERRLSIAICRPGPLH